MTKHLDDVPGHEDAHGHGASITNEHLGGLAKDIVDEERNHSACKHEGEHGIGVVVCTVHGNAEHQAERDAEAARKTVDTVNHVHGINNAYTSEDGEGNANPPRETLDAPEAMQAVDASTIAKNDAENSENLDDEAVAGSEVDYIVDGTYIEHHAHSEDDGQD